MVKERISLKVRESKIKKAGIVRTNNKSLAELGIKSGESVEISAGKRMIGREAIGDELVNKGEIYLRPKDRKSLDVDEGDKVEIKPYVTVTDIVKEEFEEIAGDTKKGAKSIKKKMKVFTEKLKGKVKKKEG